MAEKSGGYSLFGLPKLSQSSLATTDSWFWLQAFASVIFFIVTTVAALYLQGVENNIRNVSLARGLQATASASSRSSSLPATGGTGSRASRGSFPMQIMLALVTVAALAGGGLMAVDAADNAAPLVKVDYLTQQAQLQPERVIIAIDLSKSNPLIDDAAFAQKVAARVASEISGLGFASEVHVRTFGSYDAGTNNFHYDAVLSVRAAAPTMSPPRSRG